MKKSEAREFPIQLISINPKSTFDLEPLKGDCFLHETARRNFQLLLRKICSHYCELQPVATKSYIWTQPCAPGCAELLPCPSALTLSPSDADLHVNFTAYADREPRSKSHKSQMTQPSPPEISFASVSPLQHVLLE